MISIYDDKKHRLLGKETGKTFKIGDKLKVKLIRADIKLKEIDPATMQSKLIGGLYFAGDIIDVDCFTGGFNLQTAFSTGYLAGISV